MLVQFITGHNYANRHQFIIDNKKYPEEELDPEARSAALCPLCDEGDETSYHILVECGALQKIREKHFGPQVAPPFLYLKSAQIVRFLREIQGSLSFFTEADHTVI